MIIIRPHTRTRSRVKLRVWCGRVMPRSGLQINSFGRPRLPYRLTGPSPLHNFHMCNFLYPCYMTADCPGPKSCQQWGRLRRTSIDCRGWGSVRWSKTTIPCHKIELPNLRGHMPLYTMVAPPRPLQAAFYRMVFANFWPNQSPSGIKR